MNHLVSACAWLGALIALHVAAPIGLLDVSVAQSTAEQPSTIHYARDIQPILSNHCFACHGPDAEGREAGLRLDDPKHWSEELESGEGLAIESGDPDNSVLMHRVLSDDYDRMPPEDFGKPLTDQQKQLLKQWIADGAQWQPHWAYAKLQPKSSEVKSKPDEEWTKRWNSNQIDRYLADKIQQTGDGSLQPNDRADAVTLMRRVHFDLTGLPPSPEVVAKFAEDPSEAAYQKIVDQLLASPQHAEHLTRYWLDWVRFADTVGYHGDQGHAIWPYRDYVLKSFWENKPFDQFSIEQLAGDLLDNPTEDQLIASAYNRMLQTTHEGGAQDLEYREKYLADRVRNFSEVWLASTMACAQCHDHKYDPLSQEDFYSLGAFFADIDEHGSYDGKAPNATPTLRYPQKIVVSPLDRQKVPADLEQLIATSVDERLPGELDAARNRKIDRITQQREKEAKEKAQAENSDPIAVTVDESEIQLSKKEEGQVRSKLQEQVRKEIFADREIRTDWCMYTKSVKPREIRILPRGDWLDRSGKIVQPQTPSAMPPMQRQVGSVADEERATRLDLAKWLFQEDNPLPARVLANRLWYIAFHKGLSGNLGDFGFQGQWPTHPELLDYLAKRLVDSDWDIRQVLREIVTSQAYQQSSLTNPNATAETLYLQQTRPRLSAEEIRDNALEVSGLLVKTLGGPSAKPYQPAGYYRSLNFPVRKYQASTGQELYRRGVYVHWQRQFLHPMLKAFDAPTREECTAERAISNTPSAALVLLNAPEFVEAARQLVLTSAAEVKRPSFDADVLIQRMTQRTLSRLPDETEQAELKKLYQSQLSAAREPSAKELLQVATPVDWEKAEHAGMDFEQFFALTQVARVLLNLDEAVTRY